jgi:hypothetical protein
MHPIINFLTSGIIIGTFSLGLFGSNIDEELASEEPPSINSPSIVSNIVESRRVSDQEQSEVIWLARVIYSETKIPEEMSFIGWVVRNRVETSFRGSSYKEVATSYGQFSGINLMDPEYLKNIHLNQNHLDNSAWASALAIANAVYTAEPYRRPFPETVRHFYSPSALNTSPSWTHSGALILAIPSPQGGKDRFHFYKGVN